MASFAVVVVALSVGLHAVSAVKVNNAWTDMKALKRSVVTYDTARVWKNLHKGDYKAMFAFKFEDFVRAYERTYNNDSEIYRRRKVIYYDNRKRVTDWTLRFFDPNYPRNVTDRNYHDNGMNGFMDFSEEEFYGLLGYSGYRKPFVTNGTSTVTFNRQPEEEVAFDATEDDWDLRYKEMIDGGYPDAYDTSDALSPNSTAGMLAGIVRNQDQCGSCWALAVTSAIELQIARLNQQNASFRPMWNERISNQAPTLSSQMLISCRAEIGDPCAQHGCVGGTAESALDFFDKQGLVLAKHFRYSSGGVCSSDPESDISACSVPGLDTAGRIYPVIKPGWTSTYMKLPSNNMFAFLTALVDYGPLIVHVAAKEMAFYGGGSFDTLDKDTNHVAVAVGYRQPGTTDDDGEPCPMCHGYYRVKNSWGDDWGENGYVRIHMWPDDETRCEVVPVTADCTGSLFHRENGANSSATTAEVNDLGGTMVCGTAGILHHAIAITDKFHY